MITVDIRYTLPEYLEIVRGLAGYHVSAKRQRVALHEARQAAPVPLWMRLSLLSFAPLIFFYKVSKIGTCRFVVDAKGITRSSKMGTLAIGWDEVIRVFPLSNAYLFFKGKGAVPIPHRCLSPAQRTELEALLVANGHGVAD